MAKFSRMKDKCPLVIPELFDRESNLKVRHDPRLEISGMTLGGCSWMTLDGLWRELSDFFFRNNVHV